MMPSRILRDGIADSEVVAGLHDKTFRLWIHLLTAADDYGLVAIDYGPIKRACPMADWSRELVAKMLTELTDAALILPYESEGKQYAALSKWEPRINSLSAKWPLPSFGLGHVRKVYGFKSETVKKAALKILIHINDETLNSESPVNRQRTTGVSLVSEGVKGLRGKGKPLGQNSGEFGQFWTAYPRKVKRPRAEKAFAALNPNAELLQAILHALDRAKASDQWRREKGRFIPHPTTWLNDRGWEDEHEVEEQKRFVI